MERIRDWLVLKKIKFENSSRGQSDYFLDIKMILFSNVKKTICLRFLRFDTRNIISIKLSEIFLKIYFQVYFWYSNSYFYIFNCNISNDISKWIYKIMITHTHTHAHICIYIYKWSNFYNIIILFFNLFQT